MVYVVHRATGIRRIPDDWLDGFAPSGFRLATAGEIARWYDEHGLPPPAAEGQYCPACLRRVPAATTERRLHRERCASGPLEMWMHYCPTCGTALAAEIPDSAAEPDA